MPPSPSDLREVVGARLGSQMSGFTGRRLTVAAYFAARGLGQLSQDILL